MSANPRWGAIGWLVGVAEFVAGMAIAQAGWTGSTYSLLTNYISDLGNTVCAPYDGRAVCSPWHLVFNVAIGLMGLLLIAGIFGMRQWFPPGTWREAALVVLGIGGAGAVGVGLNPENVNPAAHVASAFLAFLLTNVAVVALGVHEERAHRSRGFAVYSIGSGVVGLLALALFAAHAYGPLGAGGMERLIVAPVLLWAIVTAVSALRRPLSVTAAPASAATLG